MPSTTKSSVISQTKPINVFYVWYSELCRRLNSTPAPVVKPAKTKCDTVLDFVGDRLKFDEWNPVIKALRQDTSLHVITIRSRLGNCQFLHDIDTEAKARSMKRRYGTLWTAYVLKSLLKSLSYSIRNNEVLTCLELDGLPMFSQYLEPLLQALKKNKTIKSLSLANCTIKNTGCQMVCGYLRFTPNVEILNLTCCGLTAESGEYLAKLIKYQQINRYCESWHKSLRYEEPEVGRMRGIKRLTLNGNIDFGDEGLEHIFNELEDDLWIKAIDMQKCGITDSLTEKILDIVDYNRSLEIVDLRHNDQLSLETIDKILTLLKQKQHFDSEPEFKWCATMLSLPCPSMRDTYSQYSMMTNSIQKTKSTIKSNISTKVSNLITTKSVKKSQTNTSVNKGGGNVTINEVVDTVNEEKAMDELNNQLSIEIEKRKETEKLNEDLKKKLEDIQNVTQLSQLKSKDDVNKIISALDHLKPKQNGITPTDNDRETSNEQRKNGYHKNGVITEAILNGVRHKTQNGFNKEFKDATEIFENILLRNKTDSKQSLEEDQNLLSSYIEDDVFSNTDNYSNNTNNDVTESQVSLFKYMEGLKSKDELSVNFKNLPCTSKYYVTKKNT